MQQLHSALSPASMQGCACVPWSWALADMCHLHDADTCQGSQACENVLRRECDVQLQFSHNSQVGLQDLLHGNADVALGKADITADMETTKQISSRDIFKCVTAVRFICLSITGHFAFHRTHCTCAVGLALLLECRCLAIHATQTKRCVCLAFSMRAPHVVS